MQELVLLVVSAVVLFGVLLVAVRGTRPLGGPGRVGAHRVAGLRRYRRADDSDSYAVPATAALVAALAGANIWQGLAQWGVVSTSASTVGAVLGLLAAIPWIARRILPLAGFAGSAALAIQLATTPGCSGLPRVGRLTEILLVAAGFASGWAVGRARRATSSEAMGFGLGLGIFAAIDIVRFLASPGGVDVLGELTLLLVSPVVAVLFGVGCGFAPRLILGLCALGASTAELLMTTLVGDACGPHPSSTSLTFVVCSSVTFAVAAAAVRRIP